MLCHREERIRYVEVDGAVRWQHRGGIYAVWASA
jgi:nitrate/TMAO reductase-like tetraheme cytochrome c subunit